MLRPIVRYSRLAPHSKASLVVRLPDTLDAHNYSPSRRLLRSTKNDGICTYADKARRLAALEGIPQTVHRHHMTA